MKQEQNAASSLQERCKHFKTSRDYKYEKRHSQTSEQAIQMEIKKMKMKEKLLKETENYMEKVLDQAQQRNEDVNAKPWNEQQYLERQKQKYLMSQGALTTHLKTKEERQEEAALKHQQHREKLLRRSELHHLKNARTHRGQPVQRKLVEYLMHKINPSH